MMNEEILIQYVLYDVGSEVLRDVMLQLLQPDTLEEALQSSKSKICELCEMQLLSRQDYDLLKEVPPHPEKFDIHLLTKILIHICPGVTVPQKEWFRIPDRTDSSLGSDIMRLEYMAFLPEFQPGDLAKVEAFLVRISKHGSQAIQNIQEKIEARKTDKLKAIQVRTFLTFQVATCLGQTLNTLNYSYYITEGLHFIVELCNINIVLFVLFSGLKQSLKMSSQIVCVKKCCLERNVLNLSQTFSLKGMKFFSGNLLYIVHRCLKCVLLENKAFQVAIYFLETTLTSTFRDHSFHSNTKLYAKYSNAIFGDQFYR